MKTKFKKPSLSKNVKHSAMFKDLLMTFLGTTLSIILTFGTSHLIDEHKRHEAGRQMAMLVIYDIDRSIGVVNVMLKTEEAGARATQYALDRIDSLETVPIDTLSRVVAYLTDIETSSFAQFDKSVETIFNNSQDSWNAEENMAFIKKVQALYQSRDFLAKSVETHYYFRKPITDAECYRTLMVDGLKHGSDADFYATCRRWLSDPRTINYLKYSEYRRQMLGEEVIKQFEKINRENMQLMDITDDDMIEFVNASEATKH